MRLEVPIYLCITSIFEISTPKLSKITNFPGYLRHIYRHQNEVVHTKTRLRASLFACVTSIFEISTPKLTKVTYSHQFPPRVTIPPPPSPGLVDLLAECRFGFPKPLQEETELSLEFVVSLSSLSCMPNKMMKG